MGGQAAVGNYDVFLAKIDLSESVAALSGFVNTVRIMDVRICSTAMTGEQSFADFAEMNPPVTRVSDTLHAWNLQVCTILVEKSRNECSPAKFTQSHDEYRGEHLH